MSEVADKTAALGPAVSELFFVCGAGLLVAMIVVCVKRRQPPREAVFNISGAVVLAVSTLPDYVPHRVPIGIGVISLAFAAMILSGIRWPRTRGL